MAWLFVSFASKNNRGEVGPLPFNQQNRYTWRTTSLIWDLARCQTQTDIKPIAIYANLAFPVYLYVADTWPFSPASIFPPEPCQRVAIFTQQNQLFSVLQFGARIGFILIDIVFLGASDRYQTDTKCNMKTGAAWIFGVGASDRYKTDSHL